MVWRVVYVVPLLCAVVCCGLPNVVADFWWEVVGLVGSAGLVVGMVYVRVPSSCRCVVDVIVVCVCCPECAMVVWPWVQ